MNIIDGQEFRSRLVETAKRTNNRAKWYLGRLEVLHIRIMPDGKPEYQLETPDGRDFEFIALSELGAEHYLEVSK